MNLISLCFCSFTLSMIIFSCLINLYEKRLPKVLSKVIRYGKFEHKEASQGRLCRIVIEVPKSWFRHFYFFAVLIFGAVFYVVTSVYVFKQQPPERIIQLLNILCGEERISHVSTLRVYIAVTLMTLQVYRRFYDTFFVSVFGKNSYMNLFHYLVGLLHYPGCALAILCEAPKFANSSIYASLEFNFTELTFLDYGAIVVFLWAWWHQHLTTKILGDLRKDKKGTVVSQEHKLPYGDWFQYFSAPHQIAEILMYSSISVLLWYNVTWFFVFAWVLSNQVETILLTHWWYQETFDKFPKDRKALIPLLY